MSNQYYKVEEIGTVEMGLHSFTFVNYTGEKLDSKAEQEEDLSSIRSHAMRKVHERKGRSSAEVVAIKLTAPEVPPDDPTRRLLSPRPDQNWSLLKSYLAVSLLAAEIPRDASVQLDYFVHGFTPLTFPTEHIRHGCEMIRTVASTGDPALLHALCALSAMHRAQIHLEPATRRKRSFSAFDRRKNVDMAYLRHKTRAITLLRSNFSNATAIQHKALIATVALLLLIEVLCGDPSTAIAHRRGLSELIKWSQCANSRLDFLACDVLMIDIKSAILNHSPPSLAPPVSWLARFGELKDSTILSERRRTGSGFFTRRMRRYLGPCFISILSVMAQLIDTVEENASSGAMASDIDGSQFLVLEHELVVYAGGVENDDLGDRRLSECCRLGALLYCNVCIWSWPKGATLVEALLSQLRKAMSDCILLSRSSQNSQLLLWLYFLGVLADSSSETGEFYWKGLEMTARSLGIGSEDGVRNALGRFFFVERLMSHTLQELFVAL